MEDEGVVAQDIKFTLKSLGYSIPAIASSGEEAIAKINEFSPDLVLMDIRLKGKMDGIKATKKISEDFDIPVVYLTAYADEKTIARAKKTMPYGFVIKPFEKNDLKSVIEVALYRHKRERDLQVREKLSNRIFDRSPIGMAIIDMNFRIRKVNGALLKILETSKEELVRASFFGLMEAADSKILKKDINDLVSRDDETIIFESSLGANRIKTAVASVTFTLIRDDEGEPWYYLAMIEDITERKNYEEKLEKDKNRAEECTEHSLAFLSNMSHEIKTPLSTIIGYSNLMLNSDAKGESRDYLENIRESGNLLLSIINNILDQTKIDAGQIVLEHIPYSLESVINNAASSASVLLSQRGKMVAVRKSVPGCINSIVLGDPTRVQQVMNNLMSNAVKFTSEGFIEFGFSVKGGSMLELYVRDTGIGVDPQYHARIFEPFQQAEASTTRKYGGTGLGLAISKKLVELMGGEIKLVSKTGQGHGSTFYFTLPYVPIDEEDQDEGGCATVPDGNNPPVILVVEDNNTNEKIIRTLLEKLGYTVECASDGRDAVSIYKTTNGIAAILMDIRMPVLDGMKTAEIIREIERKEKRKRTPIIAVTAAAMKEDRDRCFEAGCDYYMKKPVSYEHLSRVLKNFLQKTPRAGMQNSIDTKRTLM
ncbi:MAG TPA: response regulator [Spirochaetota bacterium]|nr:response regulator [Spirochaetota bacterium]HRZ26417.1 response regulator [Spirochaetota bacterium]